jgi:hypothetical protein
MENSQRFVSYELCDSCVHPLDATIFVNGYLTIEELACSAFNEERICTSHATCISHGTTQQSIHIRLAQEIRERVYLQGTSWSSVWCNCGPCSDFIPTQPTKINMPSMLCAAATTISKTLRKHLLMKPYKLLSVQALKPEDLAVQYEFYHEILVRTKRWLARKVHF